MFKCLASVKFRFICNNCLIFSLFSFVTDKYQRQWADISHMYIYTKTRNVIFFLSYVNKSTRGLYLDTNETQTTTKNVQNFSSTTKIQASRYIFSRENLRICEFVLNRFIKVVWKKRIHRVNAKFTSGKVLGNSQKS